MSASGTRFGIVDAATKAIAFVHGIPRIMPSLQQVLNDLAVKEGGPS